MGNIFLKLWRDNYPFEVKGLIDEDDPLIDFMSNPDWEDPYTEAEMKNRIATDPHSPGMYRVNGPLMNCAEFFNAFGVKEGDKMRNPKGKISKIW